MDAPGLALKSEDGRLGKSGAEIGVRDRLGSWFVGGGLDFDSSFGNYTNAMMHAHEYANMNKVQGTQLGYNFFRE